MESILLVAVALAGHYVGSFSFSRLFVRIFAPDCDVTKLEAKAEGGEGMKMLTIGANAVSLVLGTKLAMLVSLLETKGDKAMAEIYVNSGSQELFDAGEKWAKGHGYVVKKSAGPVNVMWGKFQ